MAGPRTGWRSLQRLVGRAFHRQTRKASAEARLRHFESVLTPRLLGTRLEGLRFLFLGTCQVEHLAPAARRFGCTASHLLYEGHAHSEVRPFDPTGLDAVVVGLTLRSILNDANRYAYDTFYLLDNWDRRQVDELMVAAASHIDACIAAVRERAGGLPVFFMSFLEPGMTYAGNLANPYDPLQPTSIVRRLNEALAEAVGRSPGCYVFNMNEAFNAVGRLELQDDGVTHASHASIISDFDDEYDTSRLVPLVSNLTTYDVDGNLSLLHSYFYNKLVDNIKIIRQIDTVKMLIVDLDDTLWRGVAAEDDIDEVLRIEGWPLGVIEALLQYKRRGGLLAICSKNDHETTVEHFRRICGNRLALDDFVSVKINWRPKSENIAEILGETNLLVENVVFIDDNPRELAEVRARFPAMRTLGGNHHDWRRIILFSPETQVAAVSAESAQRTQLVQASIARTSAEQQMPREAWLRSLEIEQTVIAVDTTAHAMFARTMELVNKTNQFNTTGARWSLQAFERHFRDGGVCLVATLKDRFVDNGLIAVAIVRPGEIVQVVLSCRVFGLGAELALGGVATRWALGGGEQIRAHALDTEKNLSSRDYFDRLGFERDGDGYVGRCAPEAPDWIRLTDRVGPSKS